MTKSHNNRKRRQRSRQTYFSILESCDLWFFTVAVLEICIVTIAFFLRCDSFPFPAPGSASGVRCRVVRDCLLAPLLRFLQPPQRPSSMRHTSIASRASVPLSLLSSSPRIEAASPPLVHQARPPPPALHCQQRHRAARRKRKPRGDRPRREVATESATAASRSDEKEESAR